MKKNIGRVDKWIRIILGIVLLSLVFTDYSFKNIGYLGLIPLFTALIGVCPLYSIFKLTTNKNKE